MMPAVAVVLGLAALTAAAYLPFLLRQNYFVGNDLCFLYRMAGDTPAFRILIKLYFSLVERFFKCQSSYYLLVNVLVHLFNSVMVFYLARRILRDAATAFISAALFSVHYINCHAVSQAMMAGELFSFGFSMLAVFSYIRSGEGRGTPKGRIFYVVSFAAFVLSIFSRATSLCLPMALAAYEMIWKPSGIRPRQAVLRALPFFAAVLLYSFVAIAFYAGMDNASSKFANLLQFPGFFLLRIYIGLVMVFTPFNFQGGQEYFAMEFGQRLGIAVPFFVFAFFILAVFCRDRAYKLCLWWLLIFCSYHAVGRGILEHYAYYNCLPAVLLGGLLIGDAASLLIKRNWPRSPACVVEILFGLALLVPLLWASREMLNVRTEVGGIVHSGLAQVSAILDRPGDGGRVVYSVDFPERIKRFSAFHDSLGNQLFTHCYRPQGLTDLITVDYGRRPFSPNYTLGELVYWLTLQERQHSKKLCDRNLSFYSDWKRYSFDEKGIDGYFPLNYPRVLLFYSGGRVWDMTDVFMPRVKVVFRVRGIKAGAISAVGDFNDWDPEATPLRKESADVWSAQISLNTGYKYLYQFLVDGNRIVLDPHSKYYALSPQHGRCSALVLVNKSVPPGLWDSAEPGLRQEILRLREGILLDPSRSDLRRLLARIYSERGFRKEAEFELSEVPR